MSELVDALTPVAQALEGLGVAYQVSGSVASSLHGVARATLDIDVLADLAESHVAGFVAALEGNYYVDAEMIRGAIRDRSSFNVIHHRTVFKVDVFLPRKAYDVQSLRRSRRERLDEAADAREFNVASPEDVLLSKLEWYDRGGRLSDRQWSDILGILRVKGGALDAAYLDRWASDLGVADLLARARSQA